MPIRTSQREVVIGIVTSIGDVLPARLAQDLAALHGTPIKQVSFSSVLRSDQRSWETNPTRKPVLVLPGLEADTLSPLSSWVALSSFPLERRVVTPLTSRAAHLRALIHLADRMAKVPAGSPSADPLSGLIRRWASAMAETRTTGLLDADEVRCRAVDTLEGIADLEAAQRIRAAQRLATAPPAAALFGYRALKVVGDEAAQKKATK